MNDTLRIQDAEDHTNTLSGRISTLDKHVVKLTGDLKKVKLQVGKLEGGTMTKAQQKKAARLIHKLATRIKLSHGGWWEVYATCEEKELVLFSEELKLQEAANGISRS